MNISSHARNLPTLPLHIDFPNKTIRNTRGEPMNLPHLISSKRKGKENIGGMWMLVMRTAFVMVLSVLFASVAPASGDDMNISQTLSDGAQSSTIAFDGFAFITGNLDAQSFFPPGKVADYFGFQYLRDNAPNGIGHNTDFLTNCALNLLYTLSDSQFATLKTLATSQVDQINLYAYKRFPLMKAFNRELNGDIPAKTNGLSLTAVKAASSDLYALDGQISFDRAVAYASIINTLNASQKANLDAMKAGGFASWTVTAQMQTAVNARMRGVSNDVCVALMTYASDIFAWYAGSQEADVYFCPERQGTYFGSFYAKDGPAVGQPGYQISVTLTADVGQAFLNELSSNHLDLLVTGLVDEQRDSLYAGAENIVQVRTDISSLLRRLITAPPATAQAKSNLLARVLEKSRTYGELDGGIVYSDAMAFAQVYKSMTATQKADMTALRKTVMSGTYSNGKSFDFSVCTTPFLYSAVISDTSVLSPYISNTDYLFGASANSTVAVTISPTSAKLFTGVKAQFTAKVTGTTSTGVTWQVNGVPGGNPTVGNISTTGVYNAPQVVPNPPTVTITAIAKADPTKSANAAVTVSVLPPVAAFKFSPGAPSAGQTVNFTDTSTGPPASWSWNFGDGSTSATRNPTHIYSKTGSYKVTLKATNGGGSSISTNTISVSAASSGR